MKVETLPTTRSDLVAKPWSSWIPFLEWALRDQPDKQKTAFHSSWRCGQLNDMPRELAGDVFVTHLSV